MPKLSRESEVYLTESGGRGIRGFVKLNGTTSQIQTDFFLFQDIFNFWVNEVDDSFTLSSSIHQSGTPQNRKVM